MNTISSEKVMPSHLKRNAYLYVRQSSRQQVMENKESTDRQYALRQRAIVLGWSEEQIIVIDNDLGKSAASATERKGFQYLVSEVGIGQAGIVLGLEVSRLARNSADWHRLLEICALTDTLILDEDGIYDPAHFNDRLLLGLKGTMSEAELFLLRARLRGGLLNKARRGELRLRLPIGLVYDNNSQIVFDPDEHVQQSVKLLFATFARTGTIYGTVKHFRKNGILFPKKVVSGSNKGELTWGALSTGRISTILHNPFYAGAYAYGRKRVRKLPNNRIKSEHLPREKWAVLIHNAHPAYISWEEFEQIEQQLKPYPKKHPWSPAREGCALLQGLVVCGLCGSRMSVQYNVRANGERIPKYVCLGRNRGFGDPSCQGMIGTKIDEAVSHLILEKMTQKALELTLAVQKEISTRIDEADRLLQCHVERAQYEADQARQRYMQVDAANRLVADSLEAAWNSKLRALKDVQENYEQKKKANPLSVDQKSRQLVLSLAADFPTVWQSPKTHQREKKRMLALLIEDITLIKKSQIIIAVCFRGGATTTLTIPRPLTASEMRATRPEVLAQLDELMNEYSDSQVAHIMNERGLLTGAGSEFNKEAVYWVRYTTKLKSLKERLLEDGMLTGKQMCALLGVCRTTLGRLRLSGRIKARVCNDLGEWLYWPPEQEMVAKKLSPSSAMDTFTARGAV